LSLVLCSLFIAACRALIADRQLARRKWSGRPPPPATRVSLASAHTPTREGRALPLTRHPMRAPTRERYLRALLRFVKPRGVQFERNSLLVSRTILAVSSRPRPSPAALRLGAVRAFPLRKSPQVFVGQHAVSCSQKITASKGRFCDICARVLQANDLRRRFFSVLRPGLRHLRPERRREGGRQHGSAHQRGSERSSQRPGFLRRSARDQSASPHWYCPAS
jgi:hypothetical protein